MKTMILKNDFLKAMKSACLIAGKNNGSDIVTQNVLLSVEDGQLQVTANNFDEVFKETMIADTSESGGCCVNAKKLFAILNKAKGDEVHLDTSKRLGYINMEIGKLETRIPLIESGVFPESSFKETKNLFFLEPKEFKDIHDKTVSFIGENESRKNLMGLHIKNLHGKISFTGADAYRIADYQIDWVSDWDFDLIFPKTSLKNVAKIFTHDRLNFYTDNNYIQIKNDHMEYQSRLIEAEYPNLDKLLQEQSYHGEVESGSLIDALEMMEIMVEKESKAVLKMSLTYDKMMLESQKLEFGDSAVEIDWKFEESEKVVGMNIRFFTEVSKIFKKEDVIKLNMTKEETPMILSSTGIPGYKAVLMPVRIQW